MIKPISIKAITDELKEYIKAQDEYVEFLGMLGYKIYLLSENRISKKLLPVPLIIGPSGSGKTYGIQKICDILSIPLYTIDGSSITKTGYKGNNVSELITASLKDNDPTIPCICFIDEIDKCGEDYERTARTQGVIYSDFLKLLENDNVISKNGNVDTTNVIFVFGGSFDRINRIRESKKRAQNVGNIFDIKKAKNKILLENTHSNQKKITREDLYQYGLNHEFLGRITTIIQTNEIKKENLKSIIMSNRNSFIQELSNYLFNEGAETVDINDSIFDYVIDKITDLSAGVRSVNSLMNTLIFDEILKEIEKVGLPKDAGVYVKLQENDVVVNIKKKEIKKENDFIINIENEESDKLNKIKKNFCNYENQQSDNQLDNFKKNEENEKYENYEEIDEYDGFDDNDDIDDFDDFSPSDI